MIDDITTIKQGTANRCNMNQENFAYRSFAHLSDQPKRIVAEQRHIASEILAIICSYNGLWPILH